MNIIQCDTTSQPNTTLGLAQGSSLRAPPAQMPRLEGPMAFLSTNSAAAPQALAGLHQKEEGSSWCHADTAVLSWLFNQNIETSFPGSTQWKQSGILTFWAKWNYFFWTRHRQDCTLHFLPKEYETFPKFSSLSAVFIHHGVSSWRPANAIIFSVNTILIWNISLNSPHDNFTSTKKSELPVLEQCNFGAQFEMWFTCN